MVSSSWTSGRPDLAASTRSRAAWSLAWRALVRLVRVRLLLWRKPYERVRKDLAARYPAAWPRGAADEPSAAPGAPSAAEPAVLAWAVAAAARRVPFASCLAQALALESLLAQAGWPSELRIGVARDPVGGFDAHAWLEHEGVVLIGDRPGLARYRVLQNAERPAVRPPGERRP